MRSLQPLLLALLILPACHTPAPRATAPDLTGWTRFRGPNGTGVAAGGALPDRIAPDGELRWRTELPPGHSSPVLAGGHVFLTALEGGRLWTYALDAETGDVRWRRDVERSRQDTLHDKNHPASPTAAVDDRVVSSFFPEFGLVTYDHSGNELWRKPLGPFQNLYGMGASPILVGDNLILPCDQNRGSFVAAFDRLTGKERWRAERPFATSGHCTPVVRRAPDGRDELLLPGSFNLDAYDAATGERLWWVGGLSFEMKSVPVLDGDRVYINGYGSPLNDPGQQIDVPPMADWDTDGDGRLVQSDLQGRVAGWFDFTDLDGSGDLDASEYGYLDAALSSVNGLLAIRAGGRGDLTDEAVLWSYHRSIPQLPSPLLYGGVLYLLNDQGGLMTTFDPETGEVLERGRVPGLQDNFFTAPVAGDGKVYLVSEAGLVAVLPEGGSFEPLSIGDFGERCYATPAIQGGRLFLRTEVALYCFGER